MVDAQAIFERWEAFSQAAYAILKPVETEEEYLEALRVLNELTDRMKTPDDPRYLGLFRLLAERIAVWEKEHEAIPEASPEEMLAFFMQQHGVSQYELDKEGIVDQSTLSKVLSGKRQISKNLAKKLAQRFHTSPEVFL